MTSVDADGPAAKAGMKAGDVVTKVGADAIADGDDLRAGHDAGGGRREVTVTVQRDGRPLELKPTLAKPEPVGHASARRGASACSGRRPEAFRGSRLRPPRRARRGGPGAGAPGVLELEDEQRPAR